MFLVQFAQCYIVLLHLPFLTLSIVYTRISVTWMFGLYRKWFIAVHKNRKDICYFARNVQIQGNSLHCDHFLRAFITDYESLVIWSWIKRDTFLCCRDTLEMEFTQNIPNTMAPTCVLFSLYGPFFEWPILTIPNRPSWSIGIHIILLKSRFDFDSHAPIQTVVSVFLPQLRLVQCCLLNLSITPICSNRAWMC